MSDKRIMIVLSEDPPGQGDDYGAWSYHHAETAVLWEGIESSQYFRIEPAFAESVGDRPGTPKYKHLIIYELAEDFERPDPSAPPPEPPGGVAPNRPATYMFRVSSPVFRREGPVDTARSGAAI